MCRNYDAGECVEDDCNGRITCHDFTDQRCVEHSYNGRNSPFLEDDEDWVTDESMSREGTLARFEALNPAATDGEVLTVARRNRSRWRRVLEILAE